MWAVYIDGRARSLEWVVNNAEGSANIPTGGSLEFDWTSGWFDQEVARRTRDALRRVFPDRDVRLVKILPRLLPIKRDGKVVKRMWGYDYRQLFRTRREALRADMRPRREGLVEHRVVFPACARCGERHDLPVEELPEPTATGMTHRAVCPTTGEEIRLRFRRGSGLNVPPRSAAAAHLAGLN